MAKERIFCLVTILEDLVILEMSKSHSNFSGNSKNVFISKESIQSVASCGKVASSILASCERRVAQWKSVPQESMIMEL